MPHILVTGATGQIGSELTLALRQRYPESQVVAAGHRRAPAQDVLAGGPYCRLNIQDRDALQRVVQQYRIDTIYHLASLLSAVAEQTPQLAWQVNMDGLTNVLEVARMEGCAVFFPSSIAAFGPETPAVHTPQVTIQRPTTLYGITKLTGELLCAYYQRRFGVDTRGLRFPGLISYKTPPGGGTTDYAVEIYYAALTQGHYSCFLQADTRLDMMYMPDALEAVMTLMEAEASVLRHRNAYNVTAMSVTPQEMAAAIRQFLPHFTMTYAVDPVRQAIADSWPRSMDDSVARTEWGWAPRFTLASMTRDMLEQLALQLAGQQEDGHGSAAP
ncbi:MAG: NAD-dependent epimerase/dehydratase family protein [Candidatus Tectimicrobiota bacterium]